jgi:hypothetical protein
MSESSTMNGRQTTPLPARPQRKQLSDQLDRMDSIIDALAEGLPEAVTVACMESSREAVKEAIIEIFTNPDLRSLLVTLQPAPTTQMPEVQHELPKPSLWQRLKAKLLAAKNAVRSVVTKVKAAVINPLNLVRQTVTTIGIMAGGTIPVRRIVLVGLAVGLVVGTACLVMPQTMAASVSAAMSACTAIAVQVGICLKKAARGIGFAT